MTKQNSEITRIREDGDFSPFPVASVAGGLVFAPCVVNLAAAQPRPLRARPSRNESAEVLRRLSRVMERAGAKMSGVVSLLQCFQGRGQTAAYVEERPAHFTEGVPTSTGTAGTALATPGALIQLDAIGIAPGGDSKIDYLGGASAQAKYTNAIRARDMIFMSGIMTNSPETQPDPLRWFGSALKLELDQIVEQKLGAVLKDAECTREDVAVAHFHLLHPLQDLGALHEEIDKYFPKNKPVFMVSPSTGLGALPGRIEITPIAVRKGGAVKTEDIEVPSLGLGMLGGPIAKRVGEFVFISTQSASDGHGVVAGVDARGSHMEHTASREMDIIIDRIQEICAAARAPATDLVRLRVYSADKASGAAAIATIRRRLGDDIPVSFVEDAESVGWLGGASVSADAVLYAPTAKK